MYIIKTLIQGDVKMLVKLMTGVFGDVAYTKSVFGESYCNSKFHYRIETNDDLYYTLFYVGY
jgi:hypothetical protein